MMSAMKIRHDLTYDAPAADVHAMLTDPAFREEVCKRLDVIRASATVEPAGSGHRVVIDQVRPADGIPSFAQKFVGDEINIVQEETWGTPTEADIHVTIPGKPGEMAGTARLTESGGVTTEVVELDIKVRLPLVAGRIEKLIGDLLVKALEVENRTGRDYLSR
jgi:uncharacterized protein YndB with AHSA1/START domain